MVPRSVISLEPFTIGVAIALATIGLIAAVRALGAGDRELEAKGTKLAYVSRNVIASEPRDPNLANNLSVFGTQAEPSDRIPPGLAQLFDALSEAEQEAGGSAEHPVGGVGPRRGRLLLEVTSPSPRRIYGVVDGSGAVCYAITGGIASRCVRRLLSGISVGLLIEDTEDGRRLYVHGLVADNVQAIDVLVKGTAFSAVIGRNVYFLELPAEGVQVNDIAGVRVAGAFGTHVVRVP
jgi:hypothetical protein